MRGARSLRIKSCQDIEARDLDMNFHRLSNKALLLKSDYDDYDYADYDRGSAVIYIVKFWCVNHSIIIGHFPADEW